MSLQNTVPREKKLREHAYLVAGGGERKPQVLAFLRSLGVSVTGPDVYVREYVSFRVEDARDLRERAQTRAVGGDRRIFIVFTPSMTTEAQNALLKVLEEPPAGAIFFFIVPSPQTLLATLRSRAQVLFFKDEKTDASTIREFLQAAPAERLEIVKTLYEHGEDDERDVREATAFLRSLEVELSTRQKDRSLREGIHAIYRARRYMMDKGSLLKPLLEQVALLVPKM